MNLGYCRVSTSSQNLDRQTDQLKACGCERIYQEKISGAKKDRPELSRLLDNLRAGDVVIVTDLTRLSRSVKDLFDLVAQIHGAGADIKSLKESWIDTTTPHGKLLFAIFAGISQFERDLIRQRTMEGLESARARGRSGGRPKKAESQIEMAVKMYQGKVGSIAEICKTTGIGKTTLYRYLAKST